MGHGTMQVRRRTERLWLGAALACCIAAAGAARGGEVVIAADAIPLEVGQRSTFALATADGQQPGVLTTAIIGKRTVGKDAVYRQAIAFGQMRVQDAWLVKGAEEFATYASFGAKEPYWRCRLPLRAGAQYEYERGGAKVRARVEGPEEIEVPAGKFTCLVSIEEREADGQQVTEKRWLAPGVGFVKVAVGGFTMSLSRVDAPRRVEPKAGTDVLSTFDVGDPLSSPLFPKAVWTGTAGRLGLSSVADIEPMGGAAGTPFCLRWTFHIKGTWASAGIVPSGDMGTPVDISRYSHASFYIKALVERNCTVTLRAKAADREEIIFVHIPIQVTTEWRRIVLSPQTHPQLETIDPRRVYLISLGYHSQEAAANVIWLDEVMLHQAGQQGEF